MSLILIFVLLIIAMALSFFKYTKSCVITLGISLILFIVVGSGLLAGALLVPLQQYFKDAEPIWLDNNAIVVLGAGVVKIPYKDQVVLGDLNYTRLHGAASLYFKCSKKSNCTLVLSGGNVNHDGKTEALLAKDVLVSWGVNSQDIILEEKSINTYQNARYSSELLSQYNFKQVFLVSSNYHLQRASLYFSYFGIKVIPASSDYTVPKLSLIPLAYNFTLTDMALHEYIGIIKIHLYQYFGWKIVVNSAGWA